MEQIKELLTKIRMLKIEKQEEVPYSIIPLLYNRITTKELLHSEIIASLLNPNSGHGCNTLFLQKFLNKIGLNDYFDNSAKYEIYVEYPINVGAENTSNSVRRIDILITWNNNAVIVENKLNDAVDQENQLDDYYYAIRTEKEDIKIDWEKYSNNKKFDVLKVVYIPRDQIKKAPHIKFDKELLKELYPSNLLEWLEDCRKDATSETSKPTLTNYIELLKYINIKNHNIMKAKQLLEELNDPNDLKKAIDIAGIINSSEWNIAKLEEIENSLKKKDQHILFKKLQDRYMEIYYENYEFWVELYCYPKYFGLWIADKSSDKEVITQEIAKHGFEHYSMERGYHYFKNDKMFEYDFPSEDKNKKLVDDIFYLLADSKKNGSFG
jgi:hypothetical protein